MENPKVSVNLIGIKQTTAVKTGLKDIFPLQKRQNSVRRNHNYKARIVYIGLLDSKAKA